MGTELAEVSSLLSLAMPAANVNFLSRGDEAVAIEVRPRERLFVADTAPLAKWSAFVLWQPPGTLCVYIVKLDRRIVECKEFQDGQTLEMVEYIKSHTFINTKWALCPGASDMAKYSSSDSDTKCVLLVPGEDEESITTCKFCDEVEGNMTEDEKQGKGGEEGLYLEARDVQVKLEGAVHDTAEAEAKGSTGGMTKKRSVIWEYFRKLDKHTVRCWVHGCEQQIRAPLPNTSNMQKHLFRMHKSAHAEYKEKRLQKLRQYKFEDRPLADTRPMRTIHYRSEVWRHFQLNRDKTKTTCHHCDSLFAYSGTTATMMRHLKSLHPNELQKSNNESGLESDHVEDESMFNTHFNEMSEEYEDEAIGDDGDVFSEKPLVFEENAVGGRYRSEVWFHFQFNADKTKTSCNYCESVFAHHGAGTTTTMMRHLQRLHPTEWKTLRKENRLEMDEDETMGNSDFQEMSDEDSDFKDEMVADLQGTIPSDGDFKFEEYPVGGRHRSEVWNHFHVNEERTKASCLHCHKLFAFCGGSTSTLLKHLRKKHPSELLSISNESELDIDNVKEESISNSNFIGKSEEYEDFLQHGSTWDDYESSEKQLKFVEHQVGSHASRSEVWKHFHINEEKTQTSCLHCHKLYAFTGATSTLMKHLRKFHPTKLKARTNESDLNIDQVKEESIANSSFEGKSEKHEDILSDGSMYDGNDMGDEIVADEDNESSDKQLKFVEYQGLQVSSRSEVWKHFHVSEDKSKTSCLHCHKLLAFCAGTTSTMMKHLRKFHPMELKSTTNEDESELKTDNFEGESIQRPDFKESLIEKEDKLSEVTLKDAKDVKLEIMAGEDEELAEKKNIVDQAGNRRSEVWKHFHLSEDKTCTSCYHCQKYLAFSGTTATMMRHLRSFHPTELQASINESASMTDHDEDEPIFNSNFEEKASEVSSKGSSKEFKFEVRPSGPRFRSEVWKHFHLNEDNTVASCDHCSSLMKYSGGTTATMLKHLQRRHPAKLQEAATNEAGPASISASSDQKVSTEERLKSEEGPGEGSSGSEVWKHFHLNEDNSRVSCEHCHRSFAFCGGSTSSLLKHLKSRHPAELKARRRESEPASAYFRRKLLMKKKKRGPQHYSEVWKHFSLNEDKTKTSCNHCKSMLAFCGGNTATMWNHLRNFHPDEIAHEKRVKHRPEFVCDLCGVSTKYRIRHMASAHGVFLTGKHTCEVCGKLFFMKCELMNHMVCHDENRSYIW